MDGIKTYWFVYFSFSGHSCSGTGNAIIGSRLDYFAVKESEDYLVGHVNKQRSDLKANKATIMFYQQTAKEASDEYYKNETEQE